jgi:hypothetical protein
VFSVLGRGELSTDLFGLGNSEFGVESKGLLPVVPGKLGVTGALAGMGETMMGAGLLALVTDLVSQAERGDVPGSGVTGLAGGKERLTETVERVGFTGSLTDLTVQGQGLLEVIGGFMGAALLQADVSDSGERLGLVVPVAGLTG